MRTRRRDTPLMVGLNGVLDRLETGLLRLDQQRQRHDLPGVRREAWHLAGTVVELLELCGARPDGDGEEEDDALYR